MALSGVGKNKLCDRLLQLLDCEREYVQLHRDTTVQQLTLAPSLEGGQLVWEDSPLVRAMIHGRILVVDEFDKAPAEVVCVLKGLLEDGEMLLPDGRRFVSIRSPMYESVVSSTVNQVEIGGGGYDGLQGRSLIQVAPGFQLVALANRPGFPFLGNDFFAEMGDAFACHVVANPDVQSELALLSAYAPNVPQVPLRAPYPRTLSLTHALQDMLTCICGAFSDLRSMSDRGELSYPFSTREAVAVARHLEAFPSDGITVALQNVLAFDVYDATLRQTLTEVLVANGIEASLMSSTEIANAEGARFDSKL